MKLFSISDPRLPHKVQMFGNQEYSVLSRSGLHATEIQLVDQILTLSHQPARILIAGNRTGVLAMIAAYRFPDAEIYCHAFDLHHARAIERNLLINGFVVDFSCDEGVKLFSMEDPIEPRPHAERTIHVACTSQIPQKEFDLALFMFTHGVMTTELVLDQLEDIHRNLTDNGLCLMTAEGDSAPLFKQDRQVFGNLKVIVDKKGLSCVSMKKKGPIKKPRTFYADFPASMPKCAPITLRSFPGVFCHRRPDMGGLALAEIARSEIKPDMKVLDMGCGCGLVGCLLASLEPTLKVTFVDSHARAIAATAYNVKKLGIQNAAFVLADEGYVERGFDLFTGNPPYYSDFHIADIFLQTAFAVLHRGGICMTVAKTAKALAEHQREQFGEVTTIPRRGYEILRSIRAGRV